MPTKLLTALLLVPILGFLGVVLSPKRWERVIYSIAIATIALEFLILLAFLGNWLTMGATPVSTSLGILYADPHITFSLDFFFDKLSAVFLGMATVITGLAFLFSRHYMHREQGFQRFFYTVLLFFIGVSFITLADNFYVLLVGWEFIGISSVLLIAFYRDRYLPVRNALKVFSVYRIADAFLLIAIWYAHHLFEQSVHFSQIPTVVAEHGNQFALLGLFVFVAALIKSAQFPFSYWLPRAMEGPTSSSAIFYGALSVHIGLFLLLRTHPLWEGSIWLRSLIAASGLTTAIVAASIARVQSSIKTQIAYASVTQIGIMYAELAAGLPWLAMLHFVSNASLRTYQLLISPSIAGYLVHDQFFNFTPPSHGISNSFLGRARATAYVLSLKEWNMNSAITQYLWIPLKSIGRACSALDTFAIQAVFLVLAIALAVSGVSHQLPTSAIPVISASAAVVSLIFYIRAYATKDSAKICWNLLMIGHLFGAIFLTLSSGHPQYFGMYGGGIVVAFIAGHLCLRYVEAKGGSIALATYHGYMYPLEQVGQLFLVTSLLFIVFPISPSFVAQDILLSFISKNQGAQVALFALSYLLVGVSAMRLYTKVFFGPYKKNPQEIAYRSS